MSEDREITDELAVQILDNAIEKCRRTLQILEISTEDFDNVYMEMCSYQLHKNTLLKEGVYNDGQ